MLEGWLAEGLGSGAIVDVEGVFVDLAALAGRRFACRPALCTPGLRERGVLSCCADLDVTLSAAERRSIDRHLPQVSLQMAARDRRWSGGAPAIYADPAARQPVLARSARRCVFAYPTPDGLRCGLHTTAEAEGLPVARLKPLPCRLFPLVLLKARGRTVLTASVGAVGAALSAPPEQRLACLRSELPPLHVSCREAIEEQFGGAFYRRLAARARCRQATGSQPGQNGQVDIQER